MSPTENPVGFYVVFLVVAAMVAVLLWCLWMVFVERPDWLWEDDPRKKRDRD